MNTKAEIKAFQKAHNLVEKNLINQINRQRQGSIAKALQMFRNVVTDKTLPINPTVKLTFEWETAGLVGDQISIQKHTIVITPETYKSTTV